MEQSDEEAVRWYLLAADQRDVKAQYNLTSLRVATFLRDFNPDDVEVEAAFAAAEARAAENKYPPPPPHTHRHTLSPAS